MSALAAHLASGAQLIMVAPGPTVPEATLRGADALFVDREGTGLSLDAAAAQIAAARAGGLFSVLRVDGLASGELEACLTLSPDALILPQITSAAQLQACVAAATGRDVGLIAQVETVEAVEGIVALMAVPGLLGFLIGPFDLARAMGCDGPDTPAVSDAVQGVAETLRQGGHVFGLPTLSGDAHAQWRARGAQLLYVTLRVFQSKEFRPCLSN